MIKQWKFDGETYIDSLVAIDELGVEAHADIHGLLRGVWGLELGVRVEMLHQLEHERVLGRLVRRGPNFDSPRCDCTDSPLWCTRADRAALLKRVVASLPDVDEDGDWEDDIEALSKGSPKVFRPEEVLHIIRHQYPASCLGNKYCFELTLVRETQKFEYVALPEDYFRTGGIRDWPTSPTRPAGTKAERERTAELLAEQYPKTNHYRVPTI